jgi:hypothetical protein
MSLKNKTTARPKVEEQSDYDSAWKDVVEELFEPFLEFFFPDIYADIDFSKGYEFVSQELRKIMPASKVGKRLADELVKVHLKDGSVKYLRIFIHIEIQGQQEANFEERVFVYYYRIFDRVKESGVEIISLVVLTDENENYRPDEFRIKRWGFDLRMKYPLVKIIDYKNKPEMREKLEKSTNPMAMVIKAQLRSYEIKKESNEKKSSVKWELIRQCYESGYSKKAIETLLKFIDWLIRLPIGYQDKLSIEVIKLEEEYKMPYVTSWEKMGEEKGEKRGIKKGKLETAKELVKRGVDINIIVEATGFSKEEIEKLATKAH